MSSSAAEDFEAYDQAVRDRSVTREAPKVCEVCGNWFTPHEDERRAAYLERKRCSQRCSAARPGVEYPPHVPMVLSHTEIAERLGMSRQNVQRIERIAMRKLRAAMEGRRDDW